MLSSNRRMDTVLKAGASFKYFVELVGKITSLELMHEKMLAAQMGFFDPKKWPKL